MAAVVNAARRAWPVLAAVALSAGVQAAEPAGGAGLYAGASVYTGSADVQTSTSAAAAHFRATSAQLGWRFDQVLSLEARYGTGSGHNDAVRLHHRRAAALLLRSDWNLFAQLDIYVFGGIARADASVDGAGGRRESVRNSGASYGIGSEYTFGRHWTASLEWWRIVAGGDYRPAALGLGFNWQF